MRQSTSLLLATLCTLLAAPALAGPYDLCPIGDPAPAVNIPAGMMPPTIYGAVDGGEEVSLHFTRFAPLSNPDSWVSSDEPAAPRADEPIRQSDAEGYWFWDATPVYIGPAGMDMVAHGFIEYQSVGLNSQVCTTHLIVWTGPQDIDIRRYPTDWACDANDPPSCPGVGDVTGPDMGGYPDMGTPDGFVPCSTKPDQRGFSKEPRLEVKDLDDYVGYRVEIEITRPDGRESDHKTVVNTDGEWEFDVNNPLPVGKSTIDYVYYYPDDITLGMDVKASDTCSFSYTVQELDQRRCSTAGVSGAATPAGGLLGLLMVGLFGWRRRRL